MTTKLITPGEIRVVVDESDIRYGIEVKCDSQGKFVTGCPLCGREMRDWGTCGSFLDNTGDTWSFTWKCDHCGCFDEPLNGDLEKIGRRYKAQKDALRRLREDADHDHI